MRNSVEFPQEMKNSPGCVAQLVGAWFWPLRCCQLGSGQGTCLGCNFDAWLGCAREQPTDVSLSCPSLSPLSLPCLVSLKSINTSSREDLKKLKTELPSDLAIPLQGIYPQVKSRSQREICTPIFIAALFPIAKTQKEAKCLSMDEWIKTMVHI